MGKVGHPIFVLLGLEVKEMTNWGSGCTIRMEGRTDNGKEVRIKFDLPVQDAILPDSDLLYGCAVECIGEKGKK